MIELPIFISLNLYGHKPAASHPWGLWGHKVVLGTFHKDVPQRVWFKRKYWNFQGFLHDLLRSKVTAIFNKALVKQQLAEKYFIFYYSVVSLKVESIWIFICKDCCKNENWLNFSFFFTCHVHIYCGLFSFFEIYYHISFSK